MAIHVAITRRVRPGREAEFQRALLEFLQASFSHSAVHGANLLVPPPGSDAREFGILRTFASESDRDEFYRSELFKSWMARAQEFTEGEPVYRQLHGLEAWFREPTRAPPRWKMAIVTWLGVFPTVLFWSTILAPGRNSLPYVVWMACVNVLVVATLTWLVMPLLTKLLRRWLTGGSRPWEVSSNDRQ